MSEQEKTAVAELNENPLSGREMDVARLLATGASNTEIARELTISPHTVKVHLRNIFEKLDVNSRTEASMLLIQRGWLTVPGLEPATDKAAADDAMGATDDAAAQEIPDPQEPISDAPLPQEAVARTAVTQPSVAVESVAVESVDEAVVARDSLRVVPGQILGWQRFYLLGAIALSLFIFIPTLLSQSAPDPNLLSDVGRPEYAPIIESASRWRGRTPMLEPRSRLAVAQTGDRIYAIGGETSDGQLVATTEVYDLSVNEWMVGAALPVPLANAAAVTLNGRIYVAGGSYNPAAGDGAVDDGAGAGSLAISDRLFAYTPSEDNLSAGAWAEIGLLPNPLAGASLLAHKDSLYLIGGWDGSSMRDEIWRVEPSDGPTDALPSWSLLERMDVARAFMGAALLNTDMYIVGGFDGVRELSFADRYNIVDKSWEQLPPLSTPRGGLQLVSNGLAVFAFGGGWAKPVSSHERFDPNTRLWSNFESPVREEWRHFGAVSHDRSIYAFGGWNGGYLNTHQQYETSLSRMLLPLIQSQSSN